MTTTSIAGLNVIRSYEGRALRAYRDAVGVWTIGYGNTNYDKSLGFTVKAGVTITAEQAEQMLVHSLRTQYEPAVARALSGQAQPAFDAGTSFHYNTGGIGKATWPKALTAGRRQAAQASLMSWDKAGGKVLSGLHRRRAREWAMIDRGDYGPEGHSGPTIIDVSASGREVVTGHQAAPLTETPAQPAPASGTGQPQEGATPPAGSVPPVPHADAVPGQLKEGDSGPEVAAVQASLSNLGYDSADPSGQYGAATAAAVAAFQANHPQLTADGRTGPATTAQLAREEQFRGSAKTTSKRTGLWGVAGTALAFVKGIPLDDIVLAGLGIALLVGLYFALRHWDEVRRNVNRSIGRVVP